MIEDCIYFLFIQ